MSDLGLNPVEMPLPQPTSIARPRWQLALSRYVGSATFWEVVSLFGFMIFFLLYGVTPWLGGAGMGLVGADEPRYAQIAHEMLQKLNGAHTLREQLSACVTPYLYGRPWLEKPALYYWRAMYVFKEFGVHDWVARLPSVSFALWLVGLTYLHMRRFRPGGHLDAALITAACVGILGFSRGASTDMQLAAPLSIGLLGWYAWYETKSKFWLFDIYFFTAVATLAKGPVAPFLVLVIVGCFAALRKEWWIFWKSLWWPGIALYFAIVLPWFIAVQHQNPTFFQEFFLEHNLERFATNRYQHEQPFWYYFVVVLLATMPWTVIALRALFDGIRMSIVEWRVRHARIGSVSTKIGVSQPGDAFPEFLVLWALIPIVFFSLSQSKLPGYILPSLPPITILSGDFLFRSRGRGLQRWVLIGHALLVGVVTAAVLLMPWFVAHGMKSMPPAHAAAVAGVSALSAAVLIVLVVQRWGVARLRVATCSVMVLLLLFLYGVGPFFGIPEVKESKRTIEMLDRAYSARPLAERLATLAPTNETVAVFRVRRDMEYGLAFYRNHEVANYDEVGVPPEEHILVVRVAGKNGVDLRSQAALQEYLEGRHYEQLFSWPEQETVVYLVGSQ
jgi:4-amino-4-deoxy-L-arabinose transferase-like glycosyltransferase